MAAAARLGVRFVAMGEPDYPKTLQATDTAPPLDRRARLGRRSCARPAVAIVGSRNASAAGLTFAERLSRAARARRAMSSCPAWRAASTPRAHKATLATGTVAVLAGGHDRIYPPENEPLLHAIVEKGGAVISEMPMGWEPRGRDFPRRNRIVSGLSYGVVVVEAARRSGSLITARFALEQGREVFAVPGSPLDPRAEGTNDLIRDGATLCAGDRARDERARAADRRRPEVSTRTSSEPHASPRHRGALGRARPARHRPRRRSASCCRMAARSTKPARADRIEVDLVSLLGPSPVAIDDLARQSGLPIGHVQMALLELEIAGRLERHGGNAVSLIATPERSDVSGLLRLHDPDRLQPRHVEQIGQQIEPRAAGRGRRARR